MKLKAQLGNDDHELEFKFDGGYAAVDIDGRKYEIVLRQPAPGVYLLQTENRVYECRVNANPQSPEDVEVMLRARSYSVTVIDPKRLRSGEHSGRQHHGSAEIIAPMPGKVVRILVEVGAQVDAGAGILVVEAMKMQNEMKTPRAGVVISVNATPGDTVNAGDVLAIVE